MVLLIAVDGQTNALIPMFTIGVFVGLTISQVGLVRHWRSTRPPRWRSRATLNGGRRVDDRGRRRRVPRTSKFLHGAWVVVIAVPAADVAVLANRELLPEGRGGAEARAQPAAAEASARAS